MAVPFEWFTSQMNWVSPLLGRTAQCVFLSSLMSSSSSVAAVGQDEDPGLEDELVLGDPDGGAHLAVGPFLGVPDVAAPENSAERRPVLLVQIRYSSAWLIGPPRDALIGRRRAYTGGVVYKTRSHPG